MSFSSSNYRITSSLSARSAVDPEQWWIRFKQILEQKDLQLIIMDRLTNPVDKYITNHIFSLTLLQQHWLMVQQIKRQLDNDTNFLIERKGNALLYHILFPNAPRLKQTQWKQNLPSPELHRQDSPHEQTSDLHYKAHYHCKMCAHHCIQPKKKNCPQSQQQPRPSHRMSSSYHFLTL